MHESFRCPVCRAKQPLQLACRRCKADLRLVVAARQRVLYVASVRDQARLSGDHNAYQRAVQELRLLAPRFQ